MSTRASPVWAISSTSKCSFRMVPSNLDEDGNGAPCLTEPRNLVKLCHTVTGLDEPFFNGHLLDTLANVKTGETEQSRI